MVDKMWKIVLSLTLLTGLGVGLYYLFGGEEKRPLNELMRQLAEESSADFTARIDRSRDVDTVLLVIASRGRDEEERFRQILVDDLVASSKYRIRTWDYVKDSVDDSVLTNFLSQINLLPHQEPHSLQTAISAAKLLAKANIVFDGVLFVDVMDFREGKRDGLGASIELEGSVYSLADQKVVSKVGPLTHEIDSRWDLRYIRYSLDETSWLLRFLCWFAFAAGLPWVSIQLVRAVVKRRKNQLTLIMLAVFTGLDVLLAWTLLCALSNPVESLGTTLVLILVAGVMGYVNYDACDYIERRLL